jgi:LPPG:FO 2-phospho-L-lactate transferase
LQEFLIRERGAGPIDDVSFRGARAARPTPEVLEALAGAQAIVIGPSNPVISIGPILAVPGIREAIRDSAAATVAVSPIVRGEVVKGPTAACMAWAREPLTVAGVAALYEGVADGLVADAGTDRVPVLETDVLMADADGRRRLAEQSLEFALGLR